MKFWNRLTGFSLAIVVICAAGLASAQEQAAGVVRISDLPDVGQQMKLRSYKVVSEHSGPSCQTETGNCETAACEPVAECDGHEVCLHRYTLRNIYWHFKYSPHWWDRFCLHHDCDECDSSTCNECGPYYDECDRGLLGNLFHCRDHCRECDECDRKHCPYCRQGNCPYHGHGHGHGHAHDFDFDHDGHGYHARRGVAPFGCYTIAYPVNPDYCDGRDGSLYAAQGYGVNVSVPLAPNVGAAYNYGWGVPSSRLTRISNPLPVPPISRLPGPPPAMIKNR